MFEGSVPENFLLPNFKKIEAECKWNSKISQNVGNSGFLRKDLNFFKIGKGGRLALEIRKNWKKTVVSRKHCHTSKRYR